LSSALEVNIVACHDSRFNMHPHHIPPGEMWTTVAAKGLTDNV